MILLSLEQSLLLLLLLFLRFKLFYFILPGSKKLTTAMLKCQMCFCLITKSNEKRENTIIQFSPFIFFSIYFNTTIVIWLCWIVHSFSLLACFTSWPYSHELFPLFCLQQELYFVHLSEWFCLIVLICFGQHGHRLSHEALIDLLLFLPCWWLLHYVL